MQACIREHVFSLVGFYPVPVWKMGMLGSIGSRIRPDAPKTINGSNGELTTTGFLDRKNPFRTEKGSRLKGERWIRVAVVFWPPVH
jgi:hypothetical protein